jgi:hypothetical protein
MKQIFQELSMAVAKQINEKFAEYTSEIKELDPSKN